MITLNADRYIHVGDGYQCLDCGELVTNRARHNRKHEEQMRAVVQEIADRLDGVTPAAKEA